ncbi:MAG: hypothetical protein IJ325_02360 [Clostridia bacterium]|nr:hypothetical protein [Clostridia bacterium]
MRRNTTKLSVHAKTRMVAHRGLSKMETENTAAAFIAACNRSYYGVETDIWRTADHKYICNHDGASGRICEENLVMEQSTLADLQALVLKDIDGNTDRNELRLCTPQEYRKICEHYGKICVPELKSNFTLDEIREIISIFDGYLDNTCFIAFNIDNLDKIKEIRPEQECQFLTGKYTDDLPEEMAKRGMGIDIAHSELTEERIKAFHDAGVQVNCWTVDDPERAETLIGWGVDYITSNILE